VQREPRAILPRAAPEQTETTEAEKPAAVEPIRQAIAEAAEQQSEQRLGSAARRAAILAAVICVLTLTIAGPVRTYFAQRTEMQQLETIQAQLRSQIADLEQQKVKLADPVFIAAQARERLGFVMPGEIPYQVQLPATAGPEALPGTAAAAVPSGQPWYTSLWHTIADTPHGPPPAAPVPDPVAPAVPAVPPTPAPPPGG
jgi:cell division protein FtsB